MAPFPAQGGRWAMKMVCPQCGQLTDTVSTVPGPNCLTIGWGHGEWRLCVTRRHEPWLLVPAQDEPPGVPGSAQGVSDSGFDQGLPGLAQGVSDSGFNQGLPGLAQGVSDSGFAQDDGDQHDPYGWQTMD